MLLGEGVNVPQKDLRMRAALLLSLSRDVGQNASDPILLVHLLTGAPILSKAFQAESQPALEPDLVLSHKVIFDCLY